MHHRKQQHLALVGMIMTLVGLVTLFFVPIIVGGKMKSDFDHVDRLERARTGINDAIQAALYSESFLMHRYLEPGNTQNHYAATQDYDGMRRAWEAAITNSEIVSPLDRRGQTQWHEGVTTVSHWIDTYLSRYVGAHDPGGANIFEDEEKQFRVGINALLAARDSAAAQEMALRRSQVWMNTAQVTVVTPMAIICFALAFLAWMNLRTLQQSWVRERDISAHLSVAVQESNHRIKNNLQVIAALIDMQIQQPGTHTPKESLEGIVHQVRAVAAVHDFFSHELKSDQIQGDQMLRQLVDLTAAPIGLKVDLELEAIALAVKQATAVALITNELLLNSGKHGATTARVVMKATGPVARLRVTDNGPGFPPDFSATESANLGLALVDTLARHDLQGHILFDNDRGARVEVTFPLVAA